MGRQRLVIPAILLSSNTHNNKERNMYKALEIQINDTNKVVAYYDEYSYQLDDIVGDDFGVQTLRIDRSHHEISMDHFHSSMKYAIEHYKRVFNPYSHRNYIELRKNAISRYAHLIGYRVLFVDLYGTSQSDWAEVVVYSPAEDHEILKDRIHSLKAWWRGEVYSVHHEQLTTYVNEADPEDKIQKWQTVDSICCVMLDSEEDLLATAKEVFNLPE